MANIFVQFSDSGNSSIIATFAGKQDDDKFPNQGQVSATDSRYLAYIGRPVETLDIAQQHQISIISQSYNSAIFMPVGYESSGGTTNTFGASESNIQNLTYMILGFKATQSTPSGFYWVDVHNAKVPFTYSDMLNLANIIAMQGWASFQKFQTLIAEIMSAANIAEVKSVTW